MDSKEGKKVGRKRSHQIMAEGQIDKAVKDAKGNQKVRKVEDENGSGSVDTGESSGPPMAKKTRESKPDFTKYYTEHRQIMENSGLNTTEMIDMRRKIHQNAEGGFKEFKTQATIKEMLLKVGVQESEIKVCAKTGFVVYLKGKAKAVKEGQVNEAGHKTVNCVALRADMDALPIPENNPDLYYKTQTDHAHMCGHDGHMASLMSFTQVFCANRDKIPENKSVRLLF